jgi:hypothetical protein
MVAATALLAACSGATAPSALPPTSETPATPTGAPGSPTPQPSPTLVPLPSLDLATPQVWYAPNMGSVDFPQLFSESDRWATARDRVDVFQFYANTLSGDPYDIGGDNVLDTFVDVDAFARLHEWGIPISVEAGVVKFFACTHGSWAEYANRAIDNVEAHGGRVSFIAMDEPLLGGQLDEGGTSCGYGIDQTAAEVAAFMQAVQAEHPDVQVGTIETMPPQTVDEVEAWIEALLAAGAKPAFLHLDVEVADGIGNPGFAADIARLRDYSEARGIPFGLILTADWQVAVDDASYHQSVVAWATAMRERIGRPTHVVFQSWIGPAPSGHHEMPRNLPDDDPSVYSHTRLILEGLAILDGGP